jgi:DNA polymerase III subunit gamma/tau
MSYLVLARKYRPKIFLEMVGQSHVVQALTNALTTKRLHHAYLFTGTRGVGKTTVSRILAKSLNCVGSDGQGGITASPCGVCEACTAIDAGRFVDYTELDAASNRGIDDITTLLEQAVYKPVQGRFKVFMIDEVHMLTGPAFNAMLKTLEEPPEYLKFVLATTDPQKVPVTVLSRCLQFNLRPMAPETIESHLSTVLQAENIKYDEGALRLLSKYAYGSMRDGLSLTDQAIAFGEGELQEAQVRQMLGAVDDSYIHAMIAALARSDGREIIQTVEQLREQGLSATSTLDQMTDTLHRMQVAQINGTDAEMPVDEIQLLYSICLHGKADLGLASDEYAALTMVLLRLLAFKPKADMGGAVAPSKKPIDIKVNPSAASAPPVQPMSLPVRAQGEPSERTEKPAVAITVKLAPTQLNTTPLGDIWFELVQKMVAAESVTALARELALQSELLHQNDLLWTLQVENELLANPSQLEKLQLAINHFHTGVNLKFQIGVVQDSAAKRLADLAQKRQAKAEEMILSDEVLQQLMREFDAKIVPGSIKPIQINKEAYVQ